MIDPLNQLAHRTERAAADGAAGDQRKEALDQVQPGAVRRHEMQMPAWTCGQPGLDLRMLVGGVVVDDQVNVEIGGHRRFDCAQEAEKLLMTVAWLALRQHLPGQHVQGREQRRRSVPLVIMGHALDIAEAQRQQRLGALQRLHLALLINAQHQGIVRRIQVQPDYIAHLLDEEGIGGQLEAFAAVRCYPKHFQVAMHAGLRDAGFCSDTTDRPVRRAIVRLLMQRGVGQRGQSLVVDCPRLTWTQFVMQPSNPPFDEPPAPLTHRGRRHSMPLGHHTIGRTLSARQHQLGTQGQRRWHRARTRDRVQLLTLLSAQVQFRLGSTHRHSGISTMKDTEFRCKIYAIN